MSTNNSFILLDDEPQIADIVSSEKLADQNQDLFPNGAASIDYIVRHRKTNGLSETGAVIRVGRNLRLVRPLFAKWLFSRRV